MSPDLGSIVSSIDKKGSDICGEKRWNKHKQIVSDFWNSIANYFDSSEVTNFKIYQDGLSADGELGIKIIEEGAKRGSKNHQIVLNLIKRGAEVRKTESVELLKKEYDYITKITQSKSFLERTRASLEYKMRRDHLTKERDEFIAKTINETLQEGEIGIIFIGAYHNVLSRISGDIIVEEIKKQEKVKAYFEEFIRGKEDDKFQQLAEYLISPVTHNKMS